MKKLHFVRCIVASLCATLLTVPLTAAQARPAAQKTKPKFAPASAYDSGGLAAASVAIADLRGNGKVDLVVANKWQGDNNTAGTVSVLLGNGDGTFQPAVTYNTGAYYAESVTVGDLRGNGVLDLVVVNNCLNLDQNGNCTGASAASVLLGNGDGTFQAAATFGTGAEGASSVATGDLRGIGILDLVIAGGCGPDCPPGAASVLLGNGDGTFQPAVIYNSGGLTPYSIAVADVSGDGIPDVVVANYCQAEGCQTDGTVGVLMGNGDGTFQPVVLYDSGSPRSNSLAIGDLRGNGILDLVVASGYGDNVVSVLLGNGNGTFQPPVTYVLDGILYEAVAIGDLNGDGIPDLAVTDGCSHLRKNVCTDGKVSVLPGNGDGTFQAPAQYAAAPFGVGAIAIGDLNGDGRTDLVLTNCENFNCNTVAVLLNETSYASKTALSASPNPAQVNQSVTFTATITPTPPNGELVTFSNGKTTLGTGTTSSGAATLTTTFSAAKTYTIKTNYPGDPFRRKSSATTKLVVSP